MLILWSLPVVAGLGILVYLMIAGVPRAAASPATASGQAPRTGLPMLGAFCVGAGVGGYFAARTNWPVGIGAIPVAAVAGIIAAIASRWVVVSVFAAPSNDPEDDPRYKFQGHVAKLTRPITSSARGRVEFEIDGAVLAFEAQSFDGSSMPAETEVVIERIDDGLAIVERWATVEQRL